VKIPPGIRALLPGLGIAVGSAVLVAGLLLIPVAPSSAPGGLAQLAPQAAAVQTVEGRVARVVETRQVEIAPGQIQPMQVLEVDILAGPLQGQTFVITHGLMTLTNESALYRAGDRVLVMAPDRPDAGRMLMITDYVRTSDLLVLGVVFLAFTVLVAGWKGARALISLAISFVIVMGFMLPHILAGGDPVVVSVAGSAALLAITLYITQGWTLKTHAAMIGVLCSLVAAGLLVAVATDAVRLTGFGSEDASLLQATGLPINLRGLLMAGMLVGTLGVLDDVIIGQASAVVELSDTDPTLNWRALYARAMNIGRDHIAATVNTLVLAYVGTALPLLLLFNVYPEPWVQILNRELVAQEVVRSLVGSLSLMTAVPIVTLVASLLSHLKRSRSRPAAAPAGAIRLQVVCDRNAFDQRLRLGPGFACLVDAGGRRVLYLAGADGLTLVHNLVMLEHEARQLDALVLARDDRGAVAELDSLLSLNPALAVHVAGPVDRETRAALAGRARLVEVDDAAEAAPGIFAARDPGGAALSLVAEAGDAGAIVAAGPAGGIVAAVEHLQRHGARSDLLLGGFGLEGASDEEIGAAVEGLRRAGVAQVAPCHDTSEPAQWKLRAAYQEACALAGAGSTHWLGRAAEARPEGALEA
jgi:uncharacterized membrane protein/metal-dependent hydrolase (beta-lactamase superfamily II)